MIYCDQCQPMTVSYGVARGVLVHEGGCPNAWRDELRDCKECGSEFKPQERYQDCCSPCCRAAYNGTLCWCEECKGDDFVEIEGGDEEE